MLLASLTLFVLATSPDPADLRPRALELHPTEQLQARTTCTIAKSLTLPNGAMKAASFLDAPLASADEGAVFIHDGKPWFDLGRVSGDRRASMPGTEPACLRVATPSQRWPTGSWSAACR